MPAVLGWQSSAAVIVPGLATSLGAVALAMHVHRRGKRRSRQSAGMAVLREFFRQHPEPVCLIDSQGRMEEANLLWERMFGTAAGLLGPASLRTVLDPEDRPALAFVLSQMRGGQRSAALFFRRRTVPDDEQASMIFRSLDCGILVTICGNAAAGAHEPARKPAAG